MLDNRIEPASPLDKGIEAMDQVWNEHLAVCADNHVCNALHLAELRFSHDGEDTGDGVGCGRAAGPSHAVARKRPRVIPPVIDETNTASPPNSPPRNRARKEKGDGNTQVDQQSPKLHIGEPNVPLQ